MITKRDLMFGSLAMALPLTEPLAEGSEANAHAVTGDAELLLGKLEGKRPMIRRSFRPPNYETTLADLSHEYTPNDAFFVRYHTAVIPEVDKDAWRLKIGGPSAANAIELSLKQLQKDFERVSITAVNQCSGNRRGLFVPRAPGVQWTHGAMGNAVWSGVRLRDLLRKVDVRADALEVALQGTDSPVFPGTPHYAKSIPIDRAFDENTLVAFEMNGKPLPHWNGAPARLIVPGWTATYWIKHINEIRVIPQAFDSFWMKTGYRIPTGAFPGAAFPSQQNPQTTPITTMVVNSLVTSPSPGSRLPQRRHATLRGWAWDGGTGIAAVDVSSDGGASWHSATLSRDLGRFAWRGFSWPIDTRERGHIALLVRARSVAGEVQRADLVPNPSGYHNNKMPLIELEVV